MLGTCIAFTQDGDAQQVHHSPTSAAHHGGQGAAFTRTSTLSKEARVHAHEMGDLQAIEQAKAAGDKVRTRRPGRPSRWLHAWYV